MVSNNNNAINMEANCSNQKCCKMDKVQKFSINQENKQKIVPNKDEIHSTIEKRKSCKSLKMIQPENNVSKLNKQNSLESSLFKRKKMSQAEKHRGWIRMKNVSAVKISIQV